MIDAKELIKIIRSIPGITIRPYTVKYINGKEVKGRPIEDFIEEMVRKANEKKLDHENSK